MTTFVLIPGAWHGAWTFEPLARRLRAHGHHAYPLTLTGVGDRKHLLTATVNLDTHIDDVVNLLEDEEITDAVLVGHSYGGMVITGAADRAPERVAGLVYVDAVVPEHGDSCWSLVTDQERAWYLSAIPGTAVRRCPSSTPGRHRTHWPPCSRRSGWRAGSTATAAGTTSTPPDGRGSPPSPHSTNASATIPPGARTPWPPATT